MSRSLFISFLLGLHALCLGQTSKEKKFVASVRKIVTAFSKQDSAELSKYIEKRIGIYQLDRMGVFDHYNHASSVSFSDSIYPKGLYRQTKGISLLPLQYADLPNWDCDTEKWSKKGLFVDTTKTDHRLSRIARHRKKYVPENISNKTIEFFYSLEKKSRRVVLCDNNGIELVFYLSYLNGTWYLTIVDNATSDCSV